jgi:hypothetical protein
MKDICRDPGGVWRGVELRWNDDVCSLIAVWGRMDVFRVGGGCFWRWKEYFSVEFWFERVEGGGEIDWVVEVSRFESLVGNFDLN